MVSNEGKALTYVITFAPDMWGEVQKFRHFAFPTHNLPLHANIALRGIEGHFEKYSILMGLSQSLAPKIVEDHEELAKQGYSKAAEDIIDERVPLEIRIALKDAQNDWFPRLKEIRDAINHSGIGSCSEHEGKISYYHDRLGKTKNNVLVTEDAFQEVSKYADNVNKFIGRVFHCLNLTLNDVETIQICGIFGSLYYQRFIKPNEARDFHSGRCKSFESFEKGLMPICPFIKSCGAYARILEQKNSHD